MTMPAHERTLTPGDIDALCEALVPRIEERLAQRFYANAGKGLLAWAWKLAKPLFWALVIYGLVSTAPISKTLLDLQSVHKP